MYQPSDELLEKYADLLVNFALGSGDGIKPEEVVIIHVDDIAKPMLLQLHKAVLKAGGHPIMRMSPSGFSKQFYELADEKQLVFFPEEYFRSQSDLIDHQIGILSDVDPHELKDIDPSKIFKSADARKKVREWLNEKESKGMFTWTLALYGTEAMAKEANMSLEEYWNVIIKACYLDVDNPKAEWRRIHDEQERIKKALDDLKIDSVHIKGANVDLTVKLGMYRKWMGGSGRNIPSYELFISPDFRGTEGYIKFDQPLYRYGNLVKDIELEFKGGKVVSYNASEGKSVIENMLKRENANQIGEFSLTDSRFSRIDRFMANTLFDENMGGRYGNTHIALGSAYKDSYTGDPSEPTKEQWNEMGYNDSPEHTDMVSTEDRTVTAKLMDGTHLVIYEDGKFIV